jgi:gentisate 1,2-dioxygenase
MSTTATTVSEISQNNALPDSSARLISELNGTHTLPLWVQMAKLNPPEPNPQCIPHIWRYDDIRPYLLRAGDLVTEKQAERRVLMLINPARGMKVLYSLFLDSVF